MCHGLVMSLSEPSVLKDKRGRATICCAGGSPCLGPGLPSLPSRLSPLSPACLQSGPPHHAALFIPVLGAMSPIPCDMATTSVLLAVAQPLHHQGFQGSWTAQLLVAQGRRAVVLLPCSNTVGWTNPITQAHGGSSQDRAVFPMCQIFIC